MKKHGLMAVFLVLCCFLAFGEDGQEEIDYLLFMFDSSSEFVDERQASAQLDNLARYLRDRDLVPGQIAIHGYAAVSQNDIDGMELSKNRAVFVMNELLGRGVSKELFAEPIGHGSVDLWGGNTDETDKIPNRRARIVVDGSIVTPATVKAADPVVVPQAAPEPEEPKEATEKSASRFPWEILLLLLGLALIAAIIFLLLKRRKKSPDKPIEEFVPVPQPEPVSVPVAMVTTVVDLEGEIRFRAWELYLERYGQNGSAEGDWYKAVRDVCARYEPNGYQCGIEDGRWQASKLV